MSRFTLTSLLLAFTALLPAQITLTANDMAAPGDIFSFATTTDIGAVDPALSGEGIVWDYSQLLAETYDADTILTVEETPLAFQFFFNNGLLYPAHNADHALKEISADLGLISIENSHSYYKTSTEEYSNVGFGADVNGLPASVRNIPVDVIYEFPLNYGDEYSGFSSRELDLPTIGYYYGEQDRNTVVEGYGTLLLPGELSYEVLKLRVVLTGADSLYSEQTGFGFNIPRPEQVTYSFVSTEEVRPVLEVTVSDVATFARFRADDPALGLQRLLLPRARLYPNPTSDVLVVDGEDLSGLSARIIDLSGGTVQADYLNSGRQITLDLSALETGHYLLELSDGSARWVESVIVY